MRRRGGHTCRGCSSTPGCLGGLSPACLLFCPAPHKQDVHSHTIDWGEPRPSYSRGVCHTSKGSCAVLWAVVWQAALVTGLHSHTQEDGICRLSVDASIGNLTLTNLQGFGRQNRVECVAAPRKLTCKALPATALLHALST